MCYSSLLVQTRQYLPQNQGWNPEGSFTGGGGGGGGALQAEDLNRAAQAVSRMRKPLFIGGGSGGAPPGIFFKIFVF